jgi:hypothetical protein
MVYPGIGAALGGGPAGTPRSRVGDRSGSTVATCARRARSTLASIAGQVSRVTAIISRAWDPMPRLSATSIVEALSIE